MVDVCLQVSCDSFLYGIEFVKQVVIVIKMCYLVGLQMSRVRLSQVILQHHDNASNNKLLQKRVNNGGIIFISKN